MRPARWQFWIDRGGTFTDCLGREPTTGTVHIAKILSSDRAPLEAIRRLLGLADHEPIPASDIRMGTTIATNALLERRGSDCALAITAGFRDLLEIGTQSRPHLFELDIRKPELLYREVVEVPARIASTGEVTARPDGNELREQLAAVRGRGIRSLAVVVLNAFRAPQLEQEIGRIAREGGFDHVSLSSEVVAEMGMVGRGDTTVVDAYLTPLIRAYVGELLAELPGSTLLIMQSSGGLTDARAFRGRNAVLSGPAAGVVAYAAIAGRFGYERAIGFDMGGTSTDVSCYDGQFERDYESEVAGVRLRAPMMSIHTVAAGGGSLCRYRGFRLTVGPQSAGADPGPLCYGRKQAQELALTDINLHLGRVVDDRFPFPLARAPVEQALEGLRVALGREGRDMTRSEIAAGFFAVANANMAEAIRQVTVLRGRDVREYALVVFGGAGGQHACPIARALGIRTLLFDRFAGVLSAYGMGLADITWHGEADAGRRPLDDELPAALAASFARLVARGSDALAAQGWVPSKLEVVGRIDLRYRGTDTPLTLELPSGDGAWSAALVRAEFERAHRALFGYARPDATVEATTLRVELIAGEAPPAEPGGNGDDLAANDQRRAAPPPIRTAPMWSAGRFYDVPVYRREDLERSVRIAGPALVLDATSTIAVDVGFVLYVGSEERLTVRDLAPDIAAPASEETGVDPVRLEIFANRFMSIAKQMGTVLRRTAMSTNIRERLDFSCAIFDREGGLVANAPHIPVHLGAMSESIRGLLAAHPAPAPGSVYATNDPAAGGSHLPDITVVTPVHDRAGDLLFFAASRGHHADIGGITPGSMPPFSRTLAEEGVVFRGVEIVRRDRFAEDALRALLTCGVHPARNPRENLADLQAQIAANQTGAQLLAELVAKEGRQTVAAYMQHVQDNAAAQVALAIAELGDGAYRFGDALDDGSEITVVIRVAGGRMAIDFAGTGGEVDSNLNAPPAVTLAAVLYVLRCLVGRPIPLNSGCLRHVDISIPAASILSPSPGRAVAGGNVETSQRIVDVLLGALGKAAASQGTMNNLTFGTARFGYYETIAGGAGATPNAPGASAVHTHMTNTRVTDPEVLEARFPVRLRRFAIRRGSGGAGRHRGGDGVVREFELLEPMQVSILSERRTRAPFGLAGGEPGLPGHNRCNGIELGGKASIAASSGDILTIETPGGGGYGTP